MSNAIKPIFLVGCPRSGTTLLQQMLDAHPDVAIAPETFFVRNFWLKRDRYGDLSQDRNYHQLVDDIIALPEFEEMELDPKIYSTAAWGHSRNYADLFLLLLEQFARKNSVSNIGEKTPNHLLYMPTLQQFFPSARFVHIVRDPRAVVKSWQTVPWTTGSLTGDANVWRRYMATARQCPASIKSSLFTLHYEQLVAAPEDTLKALCHFLQFEFSPDMLTYHQQKNLTVNPEREPWKANAKKQLSQTPMNSWQTELSSSMVTEIETATWPEMKYLGYKPLTNLVTLASAKTYIYIRNKLQRAVDRVRVRLLRQTT